MALCFAAAHYLFAMGYAIELRGQAWKRSMRSLVHDSASRDETERMHAIMRKLRHTIERQVSLERICAGVMITFEDTNGLGAQASTLNDDTEHLQSCFLWLKQVRAVTTFVICCMHSDRHLFGLRSLTVVAVLTCRLPRQLEAAAHAHEATTASVSDRRHLSSVNRDFFDGDDFAGDRGSQTPNPLGDGMSAREGGRLDGASLALLGGAPTASGHSPLPKACAYVAMGGACGSAGRDLPARSQRSTGNVSSAWRAKEDEVSLAHQQTESAHLPVLRVQSPVSVAGLWAGCGTLSMATGIHKGGPTSSSSLVMTWFAVVPSIHTRSRILHNRGMLG